MTIVRYLLPLALGLCVATPAVCFAQPAPAEQAAPAPEPNAQEIDARAKKLFADGDTQAALALYREVSKIVSGRTSWDVAANHANMAFQLGLHAEAAERIRYAFAAVPTSDPNFELYRDKIQKRLEEASAQVGVVTMVIAPAGAEVLIDGVSQGRAPLSEPVFVTPGGREVQALLAGFETQSQTINVVAGQPLTVTLSLPSATAAAPPPSPVKPPLVEDEGMSGAQLGVGATALALGGLSAIATIVFAATSASAASDAETRRAEVEAVNVDGAESPCGDGTPLVFPCAALSDATDTQASAGTTAVVLGVVSGALLVTGIVTLSLGGDDDSDVAVSATPGGLLLTGTF